MRVGAVPLEYNWKEGRGERSKEQLTGETAMRVNLTDKFIASLKPREKRYQVPDAEVRGLAVMVFPSGERSFYHVRKVRGSLERKTLGRVGELQLKDARAKGSELNGKLASWRANDFQGRSPVSSESDVQTWQQLCEFYIERHVRVKAKNPERAEKDLRYMLSYLSRWNSRPLSSIAKHDVLDMHAEILRTPRGRRTRTRNGVVQANRIIQMVRRIFYCGVDHEITNDNPAKRVGKLFPKEHKRRERIQDSEFPKFLAELETERNHDLRAFVYIALLTAARSEDIRSAKWSDMDLDAGTWKITFPKMGEDEAYTVNLHPSLIERLKQRKGQSDIYLFPSFGRKGYRASVQHGWTKFATRAGVSRLHPHDMRRTLASVLSDLNYSQVIIDEALGHKARDPYNRPSKETVRAAVFAVVDRILSFKPKLAVVSRKRRPA
jgi:integrase